MAVDMNTQKLTLECKDWSTRQPYRPVPGGGLNAGYTTVDAIANICSTLGNLGFVYGKDYIWENARTATVTFQFFNEYIPILAHLKKNNNYKIIHSPSGDVILERNTQ